MATLSQLLESLAQDPVQKGRQFEHICKWYLTHAPEYRSLINQVWLWNEWPGRWGVDCGIDIIAETKQGKLWAIQAKAYSPESSIKKSDIDSFLSESARGMFVFRLLIATTDSISHNAHQVLESQTIPTSWRLLSDLCASGLNWPENPGALHAARPKRAEPKPYQQHAIKDVVDGFIKCEQGQLRMACGTGKTLVGLWVAEQLNSQRTLVLLPSLSLLANTLRTWLINGKEDFAYLPVCSDETVQDEDALETKTADLGFPAVTDPDSVAEFLMREGKGVVFSTYHSSPIIAQAFERAKIPPFDLAIADEAHRCAGPVPRAFSTILEKHRIKAGRRLFMTATPRYFDADLRKKAKQCDLLVASMDDEEHFGPTFHSLSFSKAIELELLSDYQVAIVVIDNPTFRKYAERGEFVTTDGTSIADARTLAAHIAVVKAMREYDLRKFISFHSRVKSAAEFSKRLPEVVAWMPEGDRPSGNLICHYVSGSMPTGHREAILNGIRNSPPSSRFLISNARCLGEGIDVPSLDGVVFIDPRRSQVEIIQALGRAIRKSPKKKTGTVVLPVFVDTSTDAKKAVEGSAFRPIWKVLLALRAHDDILGETLDRLRQGLGQFRKEQLEIPGKIHIDLPVNVDQSFSDAMKLKLIESTTASWDYAFGLFKRYVKDNGHPFVPARHRTAEYYRLGAWLAEQRVAYRKKSLLPERTQALENIPGWDWEPREVWWQEGFRKLAEYVKQYGNARVRQDFVCPDGYSLGRWTADKRQRYRDNRLSESKRKALEQMSGWSWDLSRTWETGYNKLLEYSKAHYSALIPWNYKTDDGFALGHWVACKRQEYRKGELDSEIKRLIEALPGWKWIRKEARPAIGAICLEEYSKREGHTIVPASHKENGFPLGQWVAQLRRQYQERRLSSALITMAEAIMNWTWACNNSRDIDWNKGIPHLEEYAASNGHAFVPDKFICTDGFYLGKWAHNVRTARREGKLTEERIRFLSAFPCWAWGQKEMAWHHRYRALKQYAAGHSLNDLGPAYRAEDGYNLWKWSNNQRLACRNGMLSTAYVKLLNEIPGWEWKLAVRMNGDKGNNQHFIYGQQHEKAQMEWDIGIAELEAYTKQHGNADVKMSLIVDNGYPLGRWACSQRRLYLDGQLTVEQKTALERLAGWVWNRNEIKWDDSYEKLRGAIALVGRKALSLTFVSPDGDKIGVWAQIQRRAYRKGKLSERRIQLLEKLNGWYWEPKATSFANCNDNWMKRVEELRTFSKLHNHARPPKATRSKDGTWLGQWVITQRKAYRRGGLSKLQIQSLESIPGWTWNPYDDNWNSSYSNLVEYAARYMRSEITPQAAIDDGYNIGSWIDTQRREYRKNKLSSERCKKLEAIPGWKWGEEKKEKQREAVARPYCPWETFVDCLKNYKNHVGDLNVPSSYVEENGIALGSIVANVRRKYKIGRLTKDQISELESMQGWSWRHPVLATYIRTDEQWDAAYGLLLEYVKKEGHSIVPTDYITPDGQRLGYWISGQRKAYRENTLSEERLKKLESLPGWDWAPVINLWPENYQRLLRLIKDRPIREIRQTYVTPDGVKLGRWMNRQRMDKRSGTLTEEQITLMERIPGWTWNTLDAKWEEAYANLKDIALKTGSTHIPIQYKVPETGFTLGQWVRIQKRMYRQGKLDQRRTNALSQLPDWTWN